MASRKVRSLGSFCLSASRQLYTPHYSTLILRDGYFATQPINLIPPFRLSSYRSSKPEGPPEMYTNVEIVSSPEEWRFVYRLLPSRIVPDPVAKSEYPSGWSPPQECAASLPYYVDRSKNHMASVYLDRDFRGMKKTTTIKRIQGDIWRLERDLKGFLEERVRQKMVTQVHELNAQLKIRGDYLTLVAEWMKTKGF